ncbi:MAG: hypothetical protein J7K75_08375 [Desulfuromonas sp.]|nr:hypothetical protein [Desulfuromonas sp.]
MRTELLALCKSGAKADIAVRVRALVIEVEHEHPGIRAIVPVPTTDRQPLYNI